MPDVDGQAEMQNVAGTRSPANRFVYPLARLAWVLLVAAMLLTFLLGVRMVFAQLQTTCPDLAEMDCPISQLSPGQVPVLEQYQLSFMSYATITTAIFCGISLVYIGVGFTIARYRWATWYGLFTSFLLIAFGSNGPYSVFGGDIGNDNLLATLLQPVSTLMLFLQWLGLPAFLISFPNGRFIPRWSIAILLLWLLQLFFFIAPAGSPFQIGNWPPGLFIVEIAITYGSTLLVVLYHYLRVFNLVEKQQTKWLLAGFGTGIFLVVLSSIFAEPLASLWPLYALFSPVFQAIAIWLPVPVAVGIAILRYRLWDIDLLINRALVYGTLSAILGLLYYGSILLFQQILRPLIGIGSEPVIVVSTLVIAALFQPLRRHIQSLIDRRFYRRKYNAAKTLAAFNARLRDEVDLESLRQEIEQVVAETLEPAQVSLWLRQTRPVPEK